MKRVSKTAADHPGIRITINSAVLSGFDPSEGAELTRRLEAALRDLMAERPVPARFSDGHVARICPRLRIVVDQDRDLDAVLRQAARQIYAENFEIAADPHKGGTA